MCNKIKNIGKIDNAWAQKKMKPQNLDRKDSNLNKACHAMRREEQMQ